MPKISVILPIYNVEKYLRQCLDSVINQTLQDIEIICINDGSPDNSRAIIDEYAAKDSRIIAIHKENGGYGSAVNMGFDRATGEYIGIVEPDDYVELNMYEKLYNQAKTFNADVCKSGFYTYDSTLPIELQNKKWLKKTQSIEIFPNDKSFKITEFPQIINFHASLWANIYKRKFLTENNIRVNGSRSASYQDFPFMVEVMCKAERIAVVNEYLYHWRVEQNQNSSTKRSDSRLLIMPDQCEEVKKILIKENLYDKLKEEIYKHFYLANYNFYINIDWEYKRQYFNKLRKLFADLKDDKTFAYKYFEKDEIRFINDIINGRYFNSIKKCIRRYVMQIRWNKKQKYIKLFNHILYNSTKNSVNNKI